MWRQFTQWLGGMGIIVLAIAVLPRLRVGGRQLMESELPGPEVAQLPERIRQTARLLWVLYVGLTACSALALAALGWLGIDERMTEFEAVAHAFSTMPTGGFSTQPDSIQAFSAAAQWIIALFMLVAGVNFMLLYRGFVRRRPRVFAPRRRVPRCTSRSSLVASLALTIQIWGYDIAAGRGGGPSRRLPGHLDHHDDGIRDRGLRPVAGGVSLLTIFALMFVGGSAGSTDRLDQGRPPPPRRQGPAPGARPDGEPGGRHARSAEPDTGGRAHAARDRGVHPPLHRILGRSGPRIIAIDSAIGDVPLGALDTLASRRTRSATAAPGSGSPGRSPRSLRSETSPRSR